MVRISPSRFLSDRSLETHSFWIGLVTHGTDRALWAFRLPSLEEDEVDVARQWLKAIEEATQAGERGEGLKRGEREIMLLDKDRNIGWSTDERWDEVMRLLVVLPGED